MFFTFCIVLRTGMKALIVGKKNILSAKIQIKVLALIIKYHHWNKKSK